MFLNITVSRPGSNTRITDDFHSETTDNVFENTVSRHVSNTRVTDDLHSETTDAIFLKIQFHVLCLTSGLQMICTKRQLMLYYISENIVLPLIALGSHQSGFLA